MWGMVSKKQRSENTRRFRVDFCSRPGSCRRKPLRHGPQLGEGSPLASFLCTSPALLCCTIVSVMIALRAEGGTPRRSSGFRLLFTTDTLGYLEPCG